MSSFQLRAFFPGEDVAIVKHGKDYFAIRPPYFLGAGKIMLRVELYYALAYEGFRAIKQKFETWEKLVRCLAKESKRPYGPEDAQPTAEAARHLLETMTAEDYKNHIDFVKEWFEDGMVEQASKLLADLLEAPIVNEIPLFFAEVNDWIRTIEMSFPQQATFEAARELVLSSAFAELRQYHMKHARKYLHNGDVHGAYRLLCVIENAPAVSDDPELFSEVKELLGECEAKEKKQ